MRAALPTFLLAFAATAANAQAGEAPSAKATELRQGTPTFTASSDKPAAQIARCVQRDGSWSAAQRKASDHGIDLIAGDTLLGIAEEGDRRRISLWPGVDPEAGQAPAPAEMPQAGARLAALKACL